MDLIHSQGLSLPCKRCSKCDCELTQMRILLTGFEAGGALCHAMHQLVIIKLGNPLIDTKEAFEFKLYNTLFIKVSQHFW